MSLINGHNKKSPKDVINSFLDQNINVSQLLSGHYFQSDVVACLNNKKSFGLRSGTELDSIIVFNVSKLVLYDYSLGRLNFIQCSSYVRMLNYLKLSLQTHRVFMNCEQCVDFLRNKNIIP